MLLPVLVGCSNGSWTVRASQPGGLVDPEVPAVSDADIAKCVSRPGVVDTVETKSDPPSQIWVVVNGPRQRADSVATCLHQLRYQSVTVARDS